MRQLSLSTAQLLLLGLITAHSNAFAYFAIWTEVAVECPSPTNTNPFIPKCAGYYSVINNEESVYWRGEKILGADPKSFEMINRYYAKDKNHVYQNFEGTYRSYRSSSDFRSTQIQARLWKISTTHDEFWEIVYLADPKSFTIHPKYNEYAYDKNHLYYNGLLIAKTEGTSLERLNEEYIRVNDNIFSYNQLLPQVDASSLVAFYR